MSLRRRLREQLHKRSIGSKSVGQSLVEFMLLLPALLLLISVVVEFGFLLNFYLDLIDTAREVARLASDDDPVHDINGNFQAMPVSPEPYGFYNRAVGATFDLLNRAGQIQLDPARGDDLVISVFQAEAGVVVNRFPPAFVDGGGCPQGGNNGWRYYCNRKSDLTASDVQGGLDMGAPSTGLVLVEIYYHYDMVLALPWITAMMPNPVRLHAYSIMPNPSASP